MLACICIPRIYVSVDNGDMAEEQARAAPLEGEPADSTRAQMTTLVGNLPSLAQIPVAYPRYTEHVVPPHGMCQLTL